MSSQTHTAICIKATDYKESDKMLKLFTVDGQILSVVAKGIKKPAAKLKFAGQVFAFCEYTINSKNGFLTLTGASQSENLFSLSYEPNSYSAASVMLETSWVMADSVQNSSLFLSLLKGFKAILYNQKCPYCTATFFIYNSLKSAGYSSLPTWLVDLTFDTLPTVGTSDTAIKALKHAIGKVEVHLGVEFVTKMTI